MLKTAIALSAVLVTLGSTQTPNTRRLSPGASGPSAALSDLSWLAGHWHGEGLGGKCDEVWLPASGGSMIGTFRLVKDGQLVFSEFLTIVEDSGSLVMKVKHFDPDGTGWEDKDEFVAFPLVELGDEEAYFNGLTLRRLDGDRLEIFLALKQKDGSVREEAFHLRRIGPG